MSALVDAYGRKFEYLRLSLTEVCNFSCQYCLPNGYRGGACGAKSPLTPDEIESLVQGFAAMGFWKVRLTGGEPSVRPDLLEVIARISRVPGIRAIGLTTNGSRLQRDALAYRTAGVTSLNVSVDSLDRERFARITGRDRLQEVMGGVEAALAARFERVKLNCVYLRDLNDADLPEFCEWVRERPVSVRFIELMRTGQNAEFFEKHHFAGDALISRLESLGWRRRARGPGDGPAVEFARPGYQGTIGVIAPYTKDFCGACNRLRVSSTGGLRLCLFGESDFDLRPYLQSPLQRPELLQAIRSQVVRKPVSHFLKEGRYGNTQNLSQIGG